MIGRIHPEYFIGLNMLKLKILGFARDVILMISARMSLTSVQDNGEESNLSMTAFSADQAGNLHRIP